MTGHVHLLSPRMWMKNSGLLPIVGCVIGSFSMAGAYVVYMCAVKPDISLRPSVWKADAAPWKFVKETESRRLVAYKEPIPTVDPAIKKLRKEVGSIKD